MAVELPLRVVVTILECCVTFSGVKLSIRSFVLFYCLCMLLQFGCLLRTEYVAYLFLVTGLLLLKMLL